MGFLSNTNFLHKFFLSYGDGSTLKLWDLPDPQEENRHNLFIHYTDNEGNVFSYINYRITLETMMIRYLKYGNNEVLGKAL